MPGPFSSTSLPALESSFRNSRYPTTHAINDPSFFSTGPFAGRVIRAKVTELQSPKRGRKYGSVDRRPLDPAPVVLLELFEITYINSLVVETEVRDYETIDNIGLVCMVDLFEVPSTPRHVQTAPFYGFAYPSHVYADYSASVRAANSATDVPLIPSDAVHRVGNHIVTESSKKTSELAGTTFVRSDYVKYQSRTKLLFTFSDISSKIQGDFILRYRVFDIFSTTPQNKDPVVLAECYGKIFRVYSTKQFPGLEPSSELDKANTFPSSILSAGAEARFSLASGALWRSNEYP